ncbi:ZKSCAN1 [Cordylochernes scorpioides]|uniref:ZKSCAN1 n=1 Tax=Cordylochernes scorpioides TaxID=51811 RepID=A0ABY6KXS8_9ARAC|nr:ZKSCAN1 [Cordylochernes scorpioides]
MNLMKEIVAFTNTCSQTLLASNRDKLPQFSRKLAWKDTTLDEMMAFIGVIFNMGNVKKNQIRDYWSKNELLERPWFGKVMSRGRFELLYSCFSLIDDSNLVPSSHPDYNPTARFEKLIEHVNNKFIYYYKPTQNLTVDESLVCLKNRTRLRQYMPQKHHGRFGVKLWMLCESKTGYCLRMKPYKGKLFPIIKSLSYDVPMNLLQESSLLGKGYHLITDNFFTSINLAKYLLDSHTYLTGTINESLYMVNNNLLALAYKEKKSKPPVKFLSTFCDVSSGKKKVSDQRDYPQMKICYDSYMGGVDLNDQMLYTYMDERKGRKFYRKVILNIFHRALLNSFILYEQHTKDNPKLSKRAFNYSVINELVRNHLKPPVLPSTSQEVLEKLPEKRESRCVECTKEGLKRRSRTICSKCKRGLHPEPGTEADIKQFIKKYNVSFHMFSKINVNGDHTHPLWSFLKKQKSGFLTGGFIKWNFTKFLIDRQGHVTARYGPKTPPLLASVSAMSSFEQKTNIKCVKLKKSFTKTLALMNEAYEYEKLS